MTEVPFTIATFDHILEVVRDNGYGSDVEWSEKVGPPATPEQFATESIFVICNGGMKHSVALGIFDRVMKCLKAGESAAGGFRNVRKVKAIDYHWARRDMLFNTYLSLSDDETRLAWLGNLPHIGKITKYHLAKNFGVDVAKPDVHLQRLADLHGETVQGLCERLAAGCGLKARTVDVVLWRACAIGVLDSRTGAYQ